MSKLLLKNAKAILPDEIIENASILLEDGKISEITQKQIEAEKTLDISNLTVYAGFIDIHIHGAVGVDVNDAKTNDLQRLAEFLAKNGTTSWLPTFVPDSYETYKKVIAQIEKAFEKQIDKPLAQILGVHYEGVFANEKMCGALRPRFFKSFKNGDEIAQIPKLKNGIHLTTLAPEVKNGIELIRELSKQNWIVSIGHTKADYSILENAFDAGAKHLTHFFNAMTGLHHRDLGVVGWALTKKDVTFDIIADGIHVHPKILEFAVKNKTADKVSLISDSIAPTGLGDGEYKIWDEKISVFDGKTKNEKGSIAGSVITMLDAFRMMLSLGFFETEVSKMASLNPAKLLGIDKNYGSIEVGKRADLIVLDENKNIFKVFINGKMIK